MRGLQAGRTLSQQPREWSAGQKWAAIAVSVTDNCGGIQQRDIHRLFEPFYRGDPARLRDGKSAGLGLSIAKGIVEAHGGRIWVENSSRNGCRFSFTLPKLTAAA